MEVVRHQNPRRDAPTEALRGLTQKLQKGFAITIVLEDGTLFVAARGDVIDGVGKLDTKWSCHKVPRFPRFQRNSEESPAGRGISAATSSEWKISGELLYNEERSRIGVRMKNPFTYR